MKVVIKELEFEYNNKIYYCDGYAYVTTSDIIGTEYEGQYEIIHESVISHIEVDRIDIINDDGPIDVTNDSEIIEIAKEEIERYIENL